MDLYKFLLLLKKLFFFFKEIQFLFSLTLIDIILILISFFIDSKSILSSLTFNFGIFFIKNLQPCFLFLVDLLVLNLDLSRKFITFSSQSFAFLFKSWLISNILLSSKTTSLVSSGLLDVKLEVPCGDKSSFLGDSSGLNNSLLSVLDFLEFVCFFNGLNGALFS